MATLNAVDLADQIIGTLRNLGPPSMTQIAQDLQDYPVMRIWLKKDRVAIGDGIGVRRTLMTKTGGVAKHVGLLEQDDISIADHLADITVDWRHATAHWALDVRTAMMNRGKSLIRNIIRPRRMGAMIDLAQELETRAWVLRGVSDTKFPNGIPYYVVPNNTTGFNGNLPSGYSATNYILNTTTHSNYKNYTAQYSEVTPADLIFLMREAMLKMNYRPPVNIPDFRRRGDKYRAYMNATTQLNIETLAEQQNDKLGRDVASMDGQTVFKGIALTYVPQLDGTTQNPVYLINNGSFFPVMLKGDMFRETGPKPHGLMHNTVVTFMDLTYNFVCVDRRQNAVIATGTF